jgi:hypothetical protein
MNARPFELEAPTKDSAAQIIGCAATLWRVLAWDLGERYDAHMRPDHGDDWLEKLRQARLAAPGPKDLYKHPLNVHDVSFVLWEPAHHSNSPLRACLPAGVGLYDLMDEVRKQRNAEVHDAPEPTLTLLDAYAATAQKLAGLADLPMSSECDELRARIAELMSADAAQPATLDELAAQHKEFEAQAAARATRAAELLQQLKDAAGEKRALQKEIATARAAKALADEQAAMTQLEMERLLANVRRDASREVDASHLRPGDPWPVAPEGRSLRLLSNVVDLYDPESVDLLSNTLGHRVTRAAERWRSFLPHGGHVVVTAAGHGVAMVGHTWTFLGSLDDR